VQVAVVGAGPSGLSAAIAAARAGAKTILLDEHSALGGQLRYRIAELTIDRMASPVRPAVLAADLVGQARTVGVDLRPGVVAWGLFEEHLLGVVEATASYLVRADRIVLATGSTDLPLPFAGGTLPGVFSARAVQVLINHHRVLPGQRFVLLGSGADANEVAEDIRLAGGAVVATVDPGDGTRIKAEGADGVQTVSLDGVCHEADAIVVAVGRQPDPQLALMAECAAAFSAELGGFVPIRDDRLHSSDPRIIVAGDAAGLCDVSLALIEGRFAGISAAADLGLVDEPAVAAARADYEAVAGERVAYARRLQPVYAQD
jgi:NADPH-dependent 2,4-dienoyl-CoA reductase/sulfur reductase-like enzyme